jgi:zearalenone synthase (highly reducing iterative type I polyketide synthase)
LLTPLNREKVWGIREDKFLALMRLCMQADETGIGARVVTGLGTRAGSVAAGIKPPYYFETDRRFGVLARIGGGGSSSNSDQGAGAGDGGQALSATIPQAATVQDAAALVLAALVGRVAKMLDVPPSELDTGRFLHSYGVDSLAAIEIVNWALREIQARIAVFDVMAAVPMTVFCERLAARSALLPKSLLEAN